ncbi:MAG: DUF1540 domain-containing protein [Chitinispirillaceae bacterium]|nr:DUF1540 domain-containing protein [Chitinispirillaceae bacterium]
MENIVSDVSECSVESCIFNADRMCHTVAINVGGPEPLCDTFLSGSKKGGIKNLLAKIGACKVDRCKYNDDYECGAKSVSVEMKGSRAVCGTCEIA